MTGTPGCRYRQPSFLLLDKVWQKASCLAQSPFPKDVLQSEDGTAALVPDDLG